MRCDAMAMTERLDASGRRRVKGHDQRTGTAIKLAVGNSLPSLPRFTPAQVNRRAIGIRFEEKRPRSSDQVRACRREKCKVEINGCT